jgi:antitoxin (DNA-binding transcriptional repressor) of toxin-antitoxin stability system
MTTVTIAEAQSRLAELIEATPPGSSVVITRDDEPVAELVALPHPRPRPVFGNARGRLKIVVEDDEHLDDFADYS